MTEVTWHIHPDPERMAEAVATEVLSAIEDAVVACGRALIAMPGGQSPIPVFERLGSVKAPWEQVTIIPTDDRVVPAGDPLSNFSMIARYFAPLGAHLVPLTAGDVDYRRTAQAADARLRELPWPPNLIWLGMGADGHTASIFPGPDYENALETLTRAVGVVPEPLPPEAPVPRVTLSLSAIASASAIMLTISGAAKRTALEHALADGAESSAPVGRVLAAAPSPVTIHWSE